MKQKHWRCPSFFLDLKGVVKQSEFQESGMDEVILTRKERLAERFRDWPLLRLIILNWPFRLAFLAVVGVVILVAILLPKIWLSTPPGFLPEVRVSLLDKIQCWSLKRSARKAHQHGLYNVALSAWRSAWANNPGDLEALRGLIGEVPLVDEPAKQISLVISAGTWLLRLGRTNTLDLIPLAEAYARSGIPERAIEYALMVPRPWPEGLERIYLIALFKAGRIDEFRSFLAANPVWGERVMSVVNAPDTERWTSSIETEFRLISLAYLSGYASDPETRHQALVWLRKARESAVTEELAFEFEFLVAAMQHNVERCRQLLEEMSKIGLDTVRRYVIFWSLLISEGRQREAEEMIRRTNLVPHTAWDAYQLARLYTVLGLLDEANQILRNYGRSVGWVLESLVLRGELLISKEQRMPRGEERNHTLDQIRDMAVELRMAPEAAEKLAGYSYFLEGYANWVQGATPAAELALKKMLETGIPDPNLAMTVSAHLVRLGIAEYAEPLLLAHRGELWERIEYHKLLLKCASMLKHDSYVLESARKYYELAPADLNAINNYAAALLIFRREPEQAIALTLKVYAQYPDSLPSILNHAAALVLNGRAVEAEQLMRRIAVEELSASDRNQFYFIGFQVQWALKNYRQAKNLLSRVDTSLLYPEQRRWLEKNQLRFEAEAAKAEALQR